MSGHCQLGTRPNYTHTVQQCDNKTEEKDVRPSLFYSFFKKQIPQTLLHLRTTTLAQTLRTIHIIHVSTTRGICPSRCSPTANLRYANPPDGSVVATRATVPDGTSTAAAAPVSSFSIAAYAASLDDLIGATHATLTNGTSTGPAPPVATFCIETNAVFLCATFPV